MFNRDIGFYLFLYFCAMKLVRILLITGVIMLLLIIACKAQDSAISQSKPFHLYLSSLPY